MSRLEWTSIEPETLNTLFVVYTHQYELDWAKKMWGRLGKHGLTSYSCPAEYNRVLFRLAVLARYWKCWEWTLNQSTDDPYFEYEDWFTILPLRQEELPAAFVEAVRNKTAAKRDDLICEFMREMIHTENNCVFDAVMSGYGDAPDIRLALDFRHAAGVGDDFGSHLRLNESVVGMVNDAEEQEQFFNENVLSMKEFDCLSIIGNRFEV